MWKDKLLKAEKLPGTPDVLISLGQVLKYLGKLIDDDDIFGFFEKPYKYQPEYDTLIKIAEKYDLRSRNGEPNIVLFMDYENPEYNQEAVDEAIRMM